MSNHFSTQAIVNVFDRSTGRVGGVILSILLSASVFFAGQTTLTVASRIAFSLARDGVLPTALSRVNESSGIPVRALVFVLAIDVAFLLMPLVNSNIFAALTGASTVCAQISYLIPILLRATVARKTFRRNEWHLGEWSEVFFTEFVIMKFSLLTIAGSYHAVY